MNYVTQHWSFDPFLIIAIVLVIWHEIGLARLARRSRPGPHQAAPAPVDLRSTAGLAVLLIAVQSPIDYWADDYFFVHMIQHLLLMFAAPTLIVAGAPWQPLLDGLPGRSGKSRDARGPDRWLDAPAARGRRLPAPALGQRGRLQPGDDRLAPARSVRPRGAEPGSAHLADALRASSSPASCSGFSSLDRPPFRIKMSTVAQAAALLATNCVMWVLAMAMGFLSSTSWYSVYNHVPGVTLPAYADQQIGAGHPVDLRRLLGHPHHDLRDPQADGRGRQRQRGR